MIYKVRNNETGRIVTFDWNDPNPPTDTDMEEVFAAAGSFSGSDSGSLTNGINQTNLTPSTPAPQPYQDKTYRVPTTGTSAEDLGSGIKNAWDLATSPEGQSTLLKTAGKTFKDLGKNIVQFAASDPSIKEAFPEEYARTQENVKGFFSDVDRAYNLTDAEQQALAKSGLGGEALVGATKMISQLPIYIAAGGAGGAVAKGIVDKIGTEALQKAIPTVYKVLGDRATPFITEVMAQMPSQGVTAGAMNASEQMADTGTIDAGKAFTAAGEGAVGGLGGSVTPLVKGLSKGAADTLLQAVANAGGGAAVTAATGGSVKDIVMSGLLQGGMSAAGSFGELLPKSSGAAKAFLKTPTAENHATLENTLKEEMWSLNPNAMDVINEAVKKKIYDEGPDRMGRKGTLLEGDPNTVTVDSEGRGISHRPPLTPELAAQLGLAKNLDANQTESGYIDNRRQSYERQNQPQPDGTLPRDGEGQPLRRRKSDPGYIEHADEPSSTGDANTTSRPAGEPAFRDAPVHSDADVSEHIATDPSIISTETDKFWASIPQKESDAFHTHDSPYPLSKIPADDQQRVLDARAKDHVEYLKKLQEDDAGAVEDKIGVERKLLDSTKEFNNLISTESFDRAWDRNARGDFTRFLGQKEGPGVKLLTVDGARQKWIAHNEKLMAEAGISLDDVGDENKFVSRILDAASTERKIDALKRRQQFILSDKYNQIPHDEWRKNQIVGTSLEPPKAGEPVAGTQSFEQQSLDLGVKPDLLAQAQAQRTAAVPEQASVTSLPLFDSETAKPSVEQQKIDLMQKQPNPLNMGGVSMEQGSKALPKYAGSINLDRLDTPFEPKKQLTELYNDYQKGMDSARRGKITHVETQQMADQLGINEKVILRRQQGQAWNAEQLKAARDYHLAAQDELLKLTQELHSKMADGTITDQDRFRFEIAQKKMAAIQAEVMGATSEAGRALSSLNAMAKANGNSTAIREFLTGTESRGMSTDDKIKMFNDLAFQNGKFDPGKASKLVRLMNQSRGMVHRVYLESILSGPPTSVANILGNTANVAFRAGVLRPAEAGIEAIRAKAAGRTPEHFIGETPAEIVGMVRGFRPAIAQFKNNLIEGTGAAAKLEGALSSEGKRNPLKALLPTHWLAAQDGFFKTVIQSGMIHAMAFRKAKVEGLKPGSQPFNKRMADIIADPELHNDVWEPAMKESRVATFTDKPGDITRAITSFRRAFKPFGSEFVIPFVNTPMQILKQGIELTPGIGGAISAKRLIKGNLTSAQQNEEIAKLLLSSAIAVPIYMAAKAGVVTGSGPANRDESRTRQEASGWQANSIKVGDQYYSYSRLEPLATVLSVASDLSDMAKDAQGGAAAEKLVAKAIYSIKNNITNKTFFEQLDNLLKIVEDPEHIDISFLKRMSGAVVPNIITKTTSFTDDTQRNAPSIPDYLKSRTPGMSNDLPARRDIFGNPKMKQATGIEGFLSPILRSNVTNDPVGIEIARLGIGIKPPKAQHGKIVLSPKQYDEFSRIAGNTAKEDLDRTVSDPGYEGMSDSQKSRLIKDVFRKARSRAFIELKATYPDELFTAVQEEE